MKLIYLEPLVVAMIFFVVINLQKYLLISIIFGSFLSQEFMFNVAIQKQYCQ